MEKITLSLHNSSLKKKIKAYAQKRRLTISGIVENYFQNLIKMEKQKTARDYKLSAQRAGFKNIEIIPVCPFPIYTPIQMATDKKITKINKVVLKVRSIFQKYPYKTNPLFSQAHFLVGYKD